MDIKEIIKEETEKKLNDIKSNALEFIKNQIVPGITAAKDGFIEDLKKESATGSWKIKLRNQLIATATDFIFSIANDVINRIFTEKEEVSTTVQQ